MRAVDELTSSPAPVAPPGSTRLYCSRCGKAAGEQSICTGSHTHHEFVKGSLLDYCARCGIYPGAKTICTGGYTGMNSQGTPLDQSYVLGAACRPVVVHLYRRLRSSQIRALLTVEVQMWRRLARRWTHGFLQLPRGPQQPASRRSIPTPRHGPLEAHAAAARPEAPIDLEADQEARRPLAPQTSNPSPLAEPALRRQTPEVGAVCGKAARTVLCGGGAQ